MRADDFIKIMENKKYSIVNEIDSCIQVLKTKLFSIIETIILCGHHSPKHRFEGQSQHGSHI